MIRAKDGDGGLADRVAFQRGADAVGDAAEEMGADAESEEERGDDRGHREGGGAPDVGEAAEPDDFIGEARGAREEEEHRGRRQAGDSHQGRMTGRRGLFPEKKGSAG
jgi:hypothetical protein